MAKLIALLGVVVVIFGVATAITDEEKNNIRGAVIPMLTACSEEHKVSKEDILAAKQSQNIDALDPCFFACFLKKAGTLTEAGLYDPSVGKELHKKYIHSQEDLDKLDAISDTCSSVNDQPVSDGTKGCDRSKQLIQCFINNKAGFTPFTE